MFTYGINQSARRPGCMVEKSQIWVKRRNGRVWTPIKIYSLGQLKRNERKRDGICERDMYKAYRVTKRVLVQSILKWSILERMGLCADAMEKEKDSSKDKKKRKKWYEEEDSISLTKFPEHSLKALLNQE